MFAVGALASLFVLVWLTGASATGADQSPASVAASPAVPAAEKPEPAPPPEPADNSYCYVCHAPYEKEEMTKEHVPFGVGCETCHGMSEKHSGDEDGLTPPDIMFPRDKVDAACMTNCHSKDDLVASGNHDEVFVAAKKTDKTCTECHAEKHRLKVRTRIWDKATGKLLSDDGVRMMYKDSPATTGVAPPAKLKAAEFYQVRGGIPNSRHYFQADTVGNQYLFFIGNSVLAGTGLKDANLRYSAQMVQGFKKHFPRSAIIETRHTQPGGSWFGLFRCSRGQAVFGEVICSGHLAILDFAADDRSADIEQVKTSLEGLVRQIALYRATHSQILVYTLTPEMLQAYQAGQTPEYIRVSEQIAEQYGIPSLNLAQYAAQKIIAGEISFKDFSADGVNPTDAGAKIYAEAVAAFIDSLLTAGPVPDKPKPYALPAPLFPETDDNGRIVAYEDQQVQRSGNWKPGQASPIGPFRHILISNEVGATLTLKFKGSEIGVLDVVDKDSADYEYAVDGAAFRQLPAPKEATGPTMRPVSLAKGLDRKAEHELVLKVASPGTARMGGFLLNGSVADAFAGLSTLEQIDAIYAAMDPIVYQPPASRFANIPKTMSKLRDGGELRMVLLGDSIMGNTSGSSFEQLLMRDYPKCKIVKIASLRSSTGCKYYREDNRVQDYVLKHNPDLLVIGGISNGGDAEAVRSVIQQVRAQKPDTEILLLTPVFGAMRDEHIRTFTREIDTTTSNFRFNMQQVAADEKCAFFDMTGPWWAYIQDSGKTYGWFMGDAVHANSRGCQIIGRLLEIWFKE